MDIRHRNPDRGTVPAAEIISAYALAFNVSWWRLLLSTLATLLRVGGIFRLADATYKEMTDEDEQRLFGFLEQDKTNLERYEAEGFDCDDFTYRLYGALHTDRDFAAMPIYETWVRWEENGVELGHSVISYYKRSKEVVKVIEPQTDSVFYVPDDWILEKING